MSLINLQHARRSTYPSSSKLHGGSLALAGGMQGGSWFGDAAKGIANFGTKLVGRVMAGKGRRRMRGGGFWSNLGSSFTNLFNNAKNFFQKTKAISTFAPALGPVGTVAGGVAGLLGMGRYHSRVKSYRRRSGQVRKYTRRMPRKTCHCGHGRGCRC
jgi:hypothetical protein